MTIVEEYWSGIARRLQVESSALNRLIPHQGEKGRENELSLARAIERLLPPNIGVGTGIVFDHAGSVSRQCDIILFDSAIQPQLLAQTSQVLFPVETVKMVIEVKTSLSADDIAKDLPTKKESLSSLDVLPGYDPPTFGIFAYSFSGSDYERAKELIGLPENGRPDLGCVIDPGFVMGEETGYGFTPRAATDGEWAKPPQGHNEASLIIEGIQYPVYMLGQYKGERYVGDPGRALLLFCVALLEILQTGDEYAWVARYMASSIRRTQGL